MKRDCIHRPNLLRALALAAPFTIAACAANADQGDFYQCNLAGSAGVIAPNHFDQAVVKRNSIAIDPSLDRARVHVMYNIQLDLPSEEFTASNVTLFVRFKDNSEQSRIFVALNRPAGDGTRIIALIRSDELEPSEAIRVESVSSTDEDLGSGPLWVAVIIEKFTQDADPQIHGIAVTCTEATSGEPANVRHMAAVTGSVDEKDTDVELSDTHSFVFGPSAPGKTRLRYHVQESPTHLLQSGTPALRVSYRDSGADARLIVRARYYPDVDGKPGKVRTLMVFDSDDFEQSSERQERIIDGPAWTEPEVFAVFLEAVMIRKSSDDFVTLHALAFDWGEARAELVEERTAVISGPGVRAYRASDRSAVSFTRKGAGLKRTSERAQATYIYNVQLMHHGDELQVPAWDLIAAAIDNGHRRTQVHATLWSMNLLTGDLEPIIELNSNDSERSPKPQYVAASRDDGGPLDAQRAYFLEVTVKKKRLQDRAELRWIAVTNRGAGG